MSASWPKKSEELCESHVYGACFKGSLWGSPRTIGTVKGVDKDIYGLGFPQTRGTFL